jgi:hypothetical protein
MNGAIKAHELAPTIPPVKHMQGVTYESNGAWPLELAGAGSFIAQYVRIFIRICRQ